MPLFHRLDDSPKVSLLARPVEEVRAIITTMNVEDQENFDMTLLSLTIQSEIRMEPWPNP